MKSSFSNGSLNQYREHVRRVLGRLREVGLQIDIDECEFEVQSTKYLGFIVEAEKGIRIDPQKTEAILGWQSLTTPKYEDFLVSQTFTVDSLRILPNS